MPAPEAEVEEEGPPKTELEQLQWKIDTTTDEVGGSFLTNLVLTKAPYGLFCSFFTLLGHFFDTKHSHLSRPDG